jgi:3-oxoacyl-[acyl-carrier-protein] synthase II
VDGITGEEIAALDAALPNARRVLTGDLIGHSVEAQFPFGVALAAGLATRTGDASLVTSVGHHRGEGAALVRPYDRGGKA